MNFNNYSYTSLIKISSSAYRACLAHSLTTDTEEVMGLLLGNVVKTNTDKIIEIYCTISLSRNCKEKDRVEFDEIQIAKSSEYAERIGKQSGLEIRVVGWYHSHPKITVPPSHVDLNTQFSQQYQGDFVGLIFSVFNTSQQTCINTIQVIAFQSKNSDNMGLTAHYIPIEVEEDMILFENKLSNISNLALCNSPEVFSQMLKNLLIEEEEESKKYLRFTLDKDNQHEQPEDKEKSKNGGTNFIKFDYNELILAANRQALLVKIIELIALPITNGIVNEEQSLINLIEFYDILNCSLQKKLDFLKSNNI